ncbi:hypothetical protein PAXINDRAFT_68597 [Paxillus involutus ATCC 200175]|nr:hypothetical protein PAXINDRAFT_68597 [Paxillus involutus ATCC 200175]
MPPRGDPAARGGPRGRGRGAPRGTPPASRTALPAIRGGPPASGGGGLPGSHVQAVGVRRSGYGTAGRPITVSANFFNIALPECNIHHYDVILPSEKTLPARLNMELIEHLQKIDAPDVLKVQQRAWLVHCPSRDIDVHQQASDRGPNRLEISSPEDQASADVPGLSIGEERSNIEGVFHVEQRPLEKAFASMLTVKAVRTLLSCDCWPMIKRWRTLVTTSIKTTCLTANQKKLLWIDCRNLCKPNLRQLSWSEHILPTIVDRRGSGLEFLGRPGQHNILSPRRDMPDRERIRLQRFISGIRIITTYSGEHVRKTPRVIKKLSSAGASDLSFTMRDGTTMTVAQYFKSLLNRPLRFPDNICVEVNSGALLPLELCTVPPGQIMRKQVPPEKTKDVLEFATKKPLDRLQSISNGLSVLAYGQSEYVRQFGMTVDETAGPLTLTARVLTPPKLRYGQGSPQPVVTPANGAWNMIDKRFFRAAAIERWAVVIYERQQRFNQQAAQDMIKGLVHGCTEVGMRVDDTAPLVTWQNGQGRINDQLRAAGNEVFQKTKQPPTLIVVVLPDNGNDIYTAVKHFGDITVGVATQCLKSSKCFRAKPQYFANVCLKMNVKLGGINTIPDPQSVTVLTDPRNPTIVMGADVIHPAPGSDGRPSFTALVGNVDSDTAKYVATSRVQGSRVEIIQDLEEMAKHILTMYMRYRQHAEKKTGNIAPARLIFYRDGVSEGQFKEVLNKGGLFPACKGLGINPKITVIVVAKRHHVRFFPRPGEADKSGNCLAGTVVDQVVAHPTEFDWYLQSHAGLLGTSRPAHYNVLYDDNKFNADSLQSLSFALCHVYARSTRSVSIPAPVYYADIVCSRAKNHYDPQGGVDFSDSATQADTAQAEGTLEAYRRNFKPLHANMASLMYFS